MNGQMLPINCNTEDIKKDRGNVKRAFDCISDKLFMSCFSIISSFQVLVAKCLISAGTDICTNCELLLEFSPHHTNIVVFFLPFQTS